MSQIDMLKKRKNCDNCGAPLPVGYGAVVCPYCGTTYTFDSIGQVVVLEKRSGVIPLSFKRIIPNQYIETVGVDRIIDRIRSELAYKIGEEVLKYSKITYEDNPLDYDGTTLKCSVRLLDDTFKFC